MDIMQLFGLIVREGWGEAQIDEPLSRHTTWRIGGPADLFYQPAGWEACSRVLSLAGAWQIPVTFLGAGSNVLVADEGIRGLVIHTKRLKSLSWQGHTAVAGSGTALAYLSGAAAEKGLSGLEFAAGIPGTLGGAVIMNAGAYGKSLGELVTEVKTIAKSGEVKVYSQEQMEFSYRSSILQKKDELVVEVKIVLKTGNHLEIKKLTEEYLELRRHKHPLDLPNAGSVFKNPRGVPAAKLIEEVGAKGWRVGDAQVSVQHANFIVNLGKAKACDVLKLIEKVREAVKTKYSVQLETEVIKLGFDDNRR